MVFALLCLSAVLAADPSEDSRLVELTENIRRAEKLYSDIEVRVHTAYDIGTRKPSSENEVITKQYDTRFISQGDYFRLERVGNSTSSRTITVDRIRAFDGETTRVLEQGAVGNITTGRIEDEGFIKPHLLVIRHTDLAVPFSVYLAGEDAVRGHVNGRLAENLGMAVTYLGEEDFDGIACEKVLVNVLSKPSGTPHDGRIFWIAASRNYLPIRQQAFTYRFSKDIPVGESIARDLREVSPGVWFPFDVEVNSYDKFKIQETAEQHLQWKYRYLTEAVSLTPDYPKSFFSTVNFPINTAVYQVEDDKIIKSWRHGAPEADGGRTSSTIGRWGGIILLNSALAIIALGVWHFRRGKTA